MAAAEAAAKERAAAEAAIAAEKAAAEAAAEKAAAEAAAEAAAAEAAAKAAEEAAAREEPQEKPKRHRAPWADMSEGITAETSAASPAEAEEVAAPAQVPELPTTSERAASTSIESRKKKGKGNAAGVAANELRSEMEAASELPGEDEWRAPAVGDDDGFQAARKGRYKQMEQANSKAARQSTPPPSVPEPATEEPAKPNEAAS